MWVQEFGWATDSLSFPAVDHILPSRTWSIITHLCTLRNGLRNTSALTVLSLIEERCHPKAAIWIPSFWFLTEEPYTSDCMSQSCVLFFRVWSYFHSYTTNNKGLTIHDKALKKVAMYWLYFIKHRKLGWGRKKYIIWTGMIPLIVAG